MATSTVEMARSPADGSMKTLRVAMIGAGNLATRAHYPSLAALPDVEIAAICDLNVARMNEVADRYGIEHRYTDYRAMVDEVAPDAVYAIGPPHLMYDVWVWCLGQGVNLYIEKPLGTSMHQANALAHLADRHGCITQVGFQRRASPLGNLLRDACLERGPIYQATVRFHKDAPVPFLGAVDHILDDTVHAIDTLRWLCGGEVEQVFPATRRLGVPDINVVSALLTFDNGAIGHLSNSWVSGRRIFGVELHAPGICAEADLEGEGRIHVDGDVEGQRFQAAEVAGSDAFNVLCGFQAKNAEFLAGVRGRAAPSSSFADALKTMEIAGRLQAADLMGRRSASPAR